MRFLLRLPLDPNTGTAVPGTFVAGWIKRSPTGFIGTNKSCALETVRALMDDYNTGVLADPRTGHGEPAALLGRRPALTP